MTRFRGLTLVDLPEVTTLAGLEGVEELGHLTLGRCIDSPGDPDPGAVGMPGLLGLAGLDALQTVGSLKIYASAALTSLAGAPLLAAIDVLHVADNPALTQADFDALQGQLGAPPTLSCFGTLEACGCLE